MSSKAQQVAKRNPGGAFRPRTGEGLLVDVLIKSQESVTGSITGMMQADLSGLPVPERRYSADVASLMSRDSMYWLLFGQERIGGAGGELRTLIVIKLARQFAQSFVTSCRSASYQAVFEQSAPASLSPVTAEPKETVAFNASFALTAFANDEGCVDFFHSSPFAMSDSQTTKKLAVEPVLRVSLPSKLLVALINELDSQLGVNNPVQEIANNG